MGIPWFDSKEVEEFAVFLANVFCQRVPLSALEQSGSKNERALNDALRVINSQVDQFIHNKSINLYKKACFGNKLKWALKGANYPDVFIDQLVLDLLARISGQGGGGQIIQ